MERETVKGIHNRWFFAWMNYTENDVKHLMDLCEKDNFKIFVAGHEICPTTGTPHLQIFLVLQQQMGISGLLKLLHHEWHNGEFAGTWKNFPKRLGGIKPAEMKNATCIAYCKKGEQPKSEWSEKGVDGEHYGLNASFFGVNHELDNGNKLPECPYTYAMDGLLSESYDTFLDFALDNPKIAFKHHLAVQNIIDAVKVRRLKENLKKIVSHIVLNKWQTELMEYISVPLSIISPEARKIMWFYDNVGHTGKSLFSLVAHLRLNAIVLENGKNADIKHAYDGEPIVIFDLTRTTEGLVNYSAIESLTNPLIFSSKFNSKVKYRDTGAYIIIFANFLPNMRAMSQDRWDIRRYENGDYIPLNIKVEPAYAEKKDNFQAVFESYLAKEDNIKY